MPWLRQLVSGISPQRPGFDPRPMHVGYMDYVDLTQASLLVLQFSPFGINSKFSTLIIHSSTINAI